MKIVINTCYGGFSLSEAACEELGIDHTGHYGFPENRNDPRLIACVEKLGDDARGNHAMLKVVEIPDGIEWGIMDYDGLESIHEKHRSWS